MSQILFCDMRNEGFCLAICVEGCVFFGCQSACVRSLCLWCCACLVEFWLLFRDASVDLHICVGNGCARCCANPHDSSRCCFKHILSMLCHMFSDCSANCLRVFNSVDDETNESLPTLCHSFWPMNLLRSGVTVARDTNSHVCLCVCTRYVSCERRKFQS